MRLVGTPFLLTGGIAGETVELAIRAPLSGCMEPSYLPQATSGESQGAGGWGKYRLIRRIAVGGMAEIFLARAVGIERFEKPVVLKRLLPQFENSQEFVSMFLHEARLAARLHHPNIAQVYDIGRKEGAYFFTMEYVHGETLRSIFRATGQQEIDLPLEAAIFIAAGMASALHYAHERRGNDGRPLRIVHRDVSPSNVIVTHDGCVKVVDFGIAKAATQDHQTRSGTLKGKIPYMSPEQCRGEPVDRRSDIFSLGTVLYELTTGTSLFGRGNELTILRQVADGEVQPPSERRPGYSPDLERIVMKALARDVADRYQTAEKLVDDLEQFAASKKLVMSARAVSRLMEDLFGAPEEPAFDSAEEIEPLPGSRSRSRSLPLPPGPATRTISADLAEDDPSESDPTVVSSSISLSAEVSGAAPAMAPAPAQNVASLDVVSIRPDGRGLRWAAIGLASVATLLAVLVAHEKLGGESQKSGPVNARPAAAETALSSTEDTELPAAVVSEDETRDQSAPSETPADRATATHEGVEAATRREPKAEANLGRSPADEEARARDRRRARAVAERRRRREAQRRRERRRSRASERDSRPARRVDSLGFGPSGSGGDSSSIDSLGFPE